MFEPLHGTLKLMWRRQRKLPPLTLTLPLQAQRRGRGNTRLPKRDSPAAAPRLQSLDQLLGQIGDTGETVQSTTYKARVKERLIAKHRR